MKSDIKAAAKAAFPHTIPVLTGMIFAGIAYGILMTSKGFSLPWILLISVTVFAGALQFAGVSLLTSAFNPLYAFLIALVVNARHLFYGISMLEKFRGAGKLKPYLIYAMCDETFSILCSVEPPPEVDRKLFMFAVTALHQCYWFSGNIIGGLVGPLLTFNTSGIDFVMTAFFVVIFLNQWQERKNRRPALTGLGAAAVCLLVCGADNFIIPAMAVIVTALTLMRRPLAKGVNGQ